MRQHVQINGVWPDVFDKRRGIAFFPSSTLKKDIIQVASHRSIRRSFLHTHVSTLNSTEWNKVLPSAKRSPTARGLQTKIKKAERAPEEQKVFED